MLIQALRRLEKEEHHKFVSSRSAWARKNRRPSQKQNKIEQDCYPTTVKRNVLKKVV